MVSVGIGEDLNAGAGRLGPGQTVLGSSHGFTLRRPRQPCSRRWSDLPRRVVEMRFDHCRSSHGHPHLSLLYTESSVDYLR